MALPGTGRDGAHHAGGLLGPIDVVDLAELGGSLNDPLGALAGWLGRAAPQVAELGEHRQLRCHRPRHRVRRGGPRLRRCRYWRRAAAGGSPAQVIRVVDGDTVKVRSEELGEATVGVLGMDTPKTVKLDYTTGCGGPEASTHAHHVLGGATVTVDPTQDNVDRYGRILAM